MNSENSTLSVGKYTVELSTGGSHIYAIDGSGAKTWVCTTTDPEQAMTIIEGLILVEMKRFHYPDSKPKVNKAAQPIVPFLKKEA